MPIGQATMSTVEYCRSVTLSRREAEELGVPTAAGGEVDTGVAPPIFWSRASSSTNESAASCSAWHAPESSTRRIAWWRFCKSSVNRSRPFAVARSATSIGSIDADARGALSAASSARWTRSTQAMTCFSVAATTRGGFFKVAESACAVARSASAAQRCMLAPRRRSAAVTERLQFCCRQRYGCDAYAFTSLGGSASQRCGPARYVRVPCVCVCKHLHSQRCLLAQVFSSVSSTALRVVLERFGCAPCSNACKEPARLRVLQR